MADCPDGHSIQWLAASQSKDSGGGRSSQAVDKVTGWIPDESLGQSEKVKRHGSEEM
jgi:hypothetical protein